MLFNGRGHDEILVLGIIGIVKRGALSAETVGLGSVLRVASFAHCANAWLRLTND